jgi:hypothetical protein
MGVGLPPEGGRVGAFFASLRARGQFAGKLSPHPQDASDRMRRRKRLCSKTGGDNPWPEYDTKKDTGFYGHYGDADAR